MFRSYVRFLLLATASTLAAALIDRPSVIARHAITHAYTSAATAAPRDFLLSLGNGAFAFNTDATCTQTLNASVAFDLLTMADFAWHTAPFAPADPAAALREYNLTTLNTSDGGPAPRAIRYPLGSNATKAASLWMHNNRALASPPPSPPSAVSTAAASSASGQGASCSTRSTTVSRARALPASASRLRSSMSS